MEACAGRRMAGRPGRLEWSPRARLIARRTGRVPKARAEECDSVDEAAAVTERSTTSLSIPRSADSDEYVADPRARGTPSGPPASPRTSRRILDNVGHVVKGKTHAIRMALTCLFAEGHLLIEDVPGTGKTTMAKAIALSIDGTWQRIQFTPDLLPTDVTGVQIFNRQTEPVRVPSRRRLRQHRDRRRGQPCVAEDAVGAARGDGGTPGHGGLDALPRAPSVHRHRHPEPHRARGHLQPARGADRPVHDADVDRLSRPGGRGPDHRQRHGRPAHRGRRRRWCRRARSAA